MDVTSQDGKADRELRTEGLKAFNKGISFLFVSSSGVMIVQVV
jgi:hypothetical protein